MQGKIKQRTLLEPLRFITFLILYFVSFFDATNGAGSVTDITSSVGLANVDGVVAVFCDFDSDRDTDILVITTSGICCDIFFVSATY